MYINFQTKIALWTGGEFLLFFSPKILQTFCCANTLQNFSMILNTALGLFPNIWIYQLSTKSFSVFLQLGKVKALQLDHN